MANSLSIIEIRLIELRKLTSIGYNYKVPSIWIDPEGKNEVKIQKMNPYDYFLSQISKIKDLSKTGNNLQNPKWSDNAIIYNMLIRHATAFDHDGKGIKHHFTAHGFRKTGTFLKAIGLLPYIKSLGVNTIYLLPITSIGIDGKKGTLGSPYSIRNPYKLDENLSEPLLLMDIETEFDAFVEAAHLLGMNVVLEFVFRTASIDSDLAIEHPEWFYWIKSDIENRQRQHSKNENKYGPPVFNEDELQIIKEKVLNEDFENLPQPHEIYKNMFTPPPKLAARVEKKVRGLLDKNAEARIPSAFADWPPDDIQPVWSDVTYLKLYEHHEFNYIAYNTVRMYDTSLAQPKNRVTKLWENIYKIIPYYQSKFGIDGVMIDMGHALPSELRAEIIKQAKKINKNFVFWEENFSLNKKSKEEGYEAAIGYLPFDEHNSIKLKNFLKILEKEGSPVAFFATPESHNTPRAASRFNALNYSKFSWVINCFLPGLPFIHAGFELGETLPVNTGLDFKPEELSKYPVEILPLFSESILPWGSNEEWTEFLRKILEIRNEFFQNDNPCTQGRIIFIENNCDEIISFIRENGTASRKVLIIGNLNPKETIETEIDLKDLKDLKDSNFKYELVNNRVRLALEAFEIMIFEII
jgi:starch synthase (maltosyl-transferring)